MDTDNAASTSEFSATKMQIKHVHKTPRSYGLLVLKRIVCKDSECAVYKTGRCLDVGIPVFSSSLNAVIANFNQETQAFADQAQRILDGFIPFSWKYKKDESMSQIAASPTGALWGVKAAGTVHYRDASGSWTDIPGGLKQIAVGGTHVWGVAWNDQLYYRESNSWVQKEGTLKQLAVAPNGEVWGLSSTGAIYFRQGPSSRRRISTSWHHVTSGNLQQIAVGAESTQCCGSWSCSTAEPCVWGIANNKAYLYSPPTFRSYSWYWEGSWEDKGANLKQISVSQSSTEVWGLSSDGRIYSHSGCVYSCASETWQERNGELEKLKQIALGNSNQVWGLDGNDQLLEWAQWPDFNGTCTKESETIRIQQSIMLE
jgi:hypothetical protein